jgi:hypothetical protein
MADVKIIDILLSNDKYMDEWDSLCTYSINDIVTYNHSIYKSLKDDNVGNNPISSENWTAIL